MGNYYEIEDIIYSLSELNTIKSLVVKGDLILSNIPILYLPETLKIGGDLNISKTSITLLPENLQIGGSIFVDDPKNIQCSERLRKILITEKRA